MSKDKYTSLQFRSCAIDLNVSCDQELGNIRVIFPNFENCVSCEKDLKDNKHNILHLA